MPLVSNEKPLVLIAEDDADTLHVLRRALRGQDLAAVEATTREQFFAACDQRQPELVILATTTRGDDTFDWCAHLRQSADTAHLPVLMIAPDDALLIERALAAGASDVLTRPLHETLLRQRLRSLLHTARLAARLRESEQTAARVGDVERALRDADERYRRVIENISETILHIAPDTTLTFLTPTFEKFTGWTVEEWLGRSFASLIYFDDLPAAMRVFERLLRGEPQLPQEFRYNTGSGDYRIGEFVLQPQVQDRKIIGVWGVLRDITERRLAEAAEREQRELAEALRDTATALNSTLDLDELFTRILTQAARVVPSDSSNIMLIESGVARIVRSRGYAERGVEAETHAARLPISEVANLRWMVETGEPMVIPDVYAYPDWYPLESSAWIRSHVSVPIRIDDDIIGFLNLDSALPNTFTVGDGERLQSFANQVAIAIRNARLYDALRQQTETLEIHVAKRTEELERERAQLRAILDAMNEGVIYDEKLEVLYINRALAALTGYQIEEWSGYLQMLRSETMSEAELTQLEGELFATVESHHTWANELRLRRKNGSEFDAHLTCTPVLDPDWNIVGAVTVIRDISQEKALTAQKARFVAHASHELRTPITNLKTRLYLLRRQPHNLPEHLQILDEITERMRRLVEDLLDVSRFERGVIPLKPQRLVLQTLIQNVVDVQQPEAERKGLMLIADLWKTPLHVEVDPERMVQVVTNLVVNAINYTQEGIVLVRLLPGLPGDARRKPDDFAYIYVEDSGIGIAPENLPHIFQPFYRVDTSSIGSGLGLSITKEIVELHGGDISVESEPGSGTRFCVRLPLAQDDAPLDPTAERGDEHAARSS